MIFVWMIFGAFFQSIHVIFILKVHKCCFKKITGRKMATHQFDLFCTFSYLRSFLYFDSLTSTFCQIWLSYLSRSTGRSTVLVEVKLWQKIEVKFRTNWIRVSKYRKGRRYENVQKSSNRCVPRKIVTVKIKFSNIVL